MRVLEAEETREELHMGAEGTRASKTECLPYSACGCPAPWWRLRSHTSFNPCNNSRRVALTLPPFSSQES